jgi:hypothetical protein
MPRPQFTLRALLVAMLVVAVTLAWVARNARIVRERQAMLRQFSGRLFIVHRLVREPVELPWIRRLLGDEPIPALYDDLAEPEREQVQRLRGLFPEARILTRADPEMQGRVSYTFQPVPTPGAD